MQNPNIDIHVNLLEDESAIADYSIDANLQRDELLTRSSKRQNIVLDHDSAISGNAPIAVTRKESNSNSHFDFDELHKLTSTEVIDSGEICQKRETKYRDYSQSNIGHNISGPLPKLIDLTCLNQTKVFEVFALLIQSIKGKTAIIHFEDENPCWLVNLFKLSTIFRSLTIANDVEEFLLDNNERVILVTNYNHVRGKRVPPKTVHSRGNS